MTSNEIIVYILMFPCLIVAMVAITFLVLSTHKAKTRYIKFSENAKKNTKHKVLESKLQPFKLISNLSLFLSLFSFIGFMGVAALYKTTIGGIIATILFLAFVACGLLYIVSTLILYLSVPKNKSIHK